MQSLLVCLRATCDWLPTAKATAIPELVSGVGENVRDHATSLAPGIKTSDGTSRAKWMYPILPSSRFTSKSGIFKCEGGSEFGTENRRSPSYLALVSQLHRKPGRVAHDTVSAPAGRTTTFVPTGTRRYRSMMS